MSDAVQIALIAGATAAIPPLVIGVLNYLNGRKIHMLVNSKMGMELFIAMVAARTLAETKPTEENKRLAGVAEEKYREHQDRQSKADHKG